MTQRAASAVDPALRASEERYRAFIANSSEGIWRLEFDPPIDTSLPIDEQVERAYQHGTIAECNDVLPRMYGLQRAAELVGKTLDFMLPADDPAARAYLRSIIAAGYNVSDVESTERDANGAVKHFSNSMTAIVENGRLLRVWGTQRDISDRKAAERARRASEERFRLMADASPLLMWASGPEGQLTWFNQPWLLFVGRTLDEALRDGWAAYLHPDDAEAVQESYTTAFDRREPFRIEYRLRRHDGEYRLLLDKGVPVHEPDGRFGGYIGTAIDITEQGLAAAAQAHLAAIIESADDAIISKDLNGIIRTANATAERVFGYGPGELIGVPVRILIPADRQSEEDGILARIRRGERIEHFETKRVRKDGKLIDISLTVSPIKDAAGTVVGVSKIARDVTAQKKAAAELATQQAWFRITLASIADAVIASDVGGRVVFMNPVAERLTGWRVEQARGRPCRDVFYLIDEHTRTRLDDPVAQVLSHGAWTGFGHDTLLVGKDSTEHPIDESGAPIRGRDGRMIGVVLVFHDVSERRRLDTERQASSTERERLLGAERAARAEAERASRVKDEFVAMVSHELRTPLNAILGWTQLMMRARHDPATVDRGLDVVARNTRLQAQLISDLLDISRIVAGKLQLEVVSVEVDTLVQEAVDTIRQEAEAKRIELHVTVTPAGTVAGDPARLQQVIWNLLSNAVKFTPAGGRITVHVRRVKDSAEVTVADNGPGIRTDVLPYVFDRFHQADRAITRRFGGLGLGLAIVKHLVELHGGRVQADSAGEGRGATFTVTLPTTDVAAVADRPAERADRYASVSLGSVRILLVEDEPDTREFLRRLLEGHGAIVETSASAHEALDAFRRQPPDVLVSDIGLPEVDGYDLMDQIRRSGLPEGRTVPAIALTAYARAEDRTRALTAGFQTHIAKPVEPGELLASIANIISVGSQFDRP